MKQHTVLWLTKQIRRRLPAVAVLTAANTCHALLGVLFALGSRGVIDSAVAGDQERFLKACLYQGGIVLGILICLLIVRHLRERLTADLEWDWKQRLLHGLLHGEYSAVSGYHSAEILNRLNNDVAKVDNGIIMILPNLASMVARAVAAVIVLGSLDLRFTLLMAALGAVVIPLTAVLRKRIKSLTKAVSECDGRVSGHLQETIEKLLIVQAMDISEEVERRSDVLLEERYRIQRKRKNIALIMHMGISVMFYGCGFLALVWCSRELLRGQMSFGSLTAVIQLVNQLQTPFANLSNIVPQYIAMMASAERLMELDAIQGDAEATLEDVAGTYQQMDIIRMEGMTFSYDRDRVIEEAEFALPKGSFTVITGASGIGKSTLLKLLLGVFKPEKGTLSADCGIRKLCLDRSTRKLFAYVPQGNLLFSGTIRENLLLVNPTASEEELSRALFVSGAEEFIRQLPQGLNTRLGESGEGLSEGQAQRLAIARAILGGAPILLLDECTSALDEETERKVLQRIRDLPDRTCIAVTHRPAATALCDWRLEVRDGKIYQTQMRKISDVPQAVPAEA